MAEAEVGGWISVSFRPGRVTQQDPVSKKQYLIFVSDKYKCMSNYKNIVSVPGSPHLSSGTRKAEVETSFPVPKREMTNKTGTIERNRNTHLKDTLKTKSKMRETLPCQQLLFGGGGRVSQYNPDYICHPSVSPKC